MKFKKIISIEQKGLDFCGAKLHKLLDENYLWIQLFDLEQMIIFLKEVVVAT